MSTGFRKSLFGFNCDEVVAYIEKAHKTFKEKELLLNEKIDSLSSELKESKEKNLALTEENAKIYAELSVFKEKYAEIERLSENIGKLYLVAQTNARTIMDNAMSDKAIAEEEINKNLSLLNNAQDSYNEMKENIIKSTYDFVGGVDGLLQSIEDSVKKIQDNNILDEKAKNEFEAIYENITK